MKLYKFYIYESGKNGQYTNSHYAFLPINKHDERWEFNEKGIDGLFTAIKPHALKTNGRDPNTDVAVVQYIDANIKRQDASRVDITSANIAYFTTIAEIEKVGGIDPKLKKDFFDNFMHPHYK